MSNELERYSLIETKMPREFLLLQGKGCVWKKCTFCDYYNDISDDPFAVNKPVIDKITGKFGIVDVINSGSIFELDIETLTYLRERLYAVKTKFLWCEAHWVYHKRLDDIRDFFKDITIKFRIGAETFDIPLRRLIKKGIPDNVDANEISRYFNGCCLLICFKGQTKEIILSDIQLAKENFEYFSINVFTENSTNIKQDKELLKWFLADIFPSLNMENNIEILINNSDLGVG